MRIVVKVGTSTLAHSTGLMNIRHVESLCQVLSDVKNAGHEVILVSSGAIGMGAGKLSLKERPRDIPTKQAAAAVGQCELMYAYDRLFSQYNHTVAQILLTGSDVEDPARRENFHNTMFRLLELGALPVINENDTVATDEIVIGAPYWDLSFPAALKIYIEHAAVMGMTFHYTEEGRCEGLCRAKHLTYITTGGGQVSAMNYGYEYLCGIASMFGIPETRFAAAENLDVVGADIEANLNEARKVLSRLKATR